MIRREEPDAYVLIPQDGHALLAGELARHVGNAAFAPMSRGEASVLGVTLHDAGWPLHDDAPTRNSDGLPLDVFESTPEVALPVWAASAERAAARDAYGGLLVSLHSLSLSLLATSGQAPGKHERHDTSDPRRRFEVNKFQHREIERQERLRVALGLSLERPLKHGLAEEGVDPAEDLLRFDFRLLQALDQISLALCCTEPPASRSTEVHSRPGERPIRWDFSLTGDRSLRVAPWPFDVREIAVNVECRRVPRRAYPHDADLRATYAAARVERLEFRVHE